MVGARIRPSGPGHAGRLVGALLTAALGATFAQSTSPARALTEVDAVVANDASTAAAPASPDDVVVPLQIPPLDCSGGTIYQIQRPTAGTTTGRLNAVSVGAMTGTTPVSATQVTASLLPAGGNALGISEGGLSAWALAPQTPGGTGNVLIFSLHSFDPATEVWSPHTATIDTTGRLPAGVTPASIRSGGIVAGAIDPVSGNFYWASLANAPNNSMTIFGWNTTTNAPIGVVANSTWPEDTPATGGTNGDIAFDRAGNLYIVSSVGVEAATGVIPGPLPTTQQTPTPTLVDTRLAEYANPNADAFNGIAFDNTGSLFIQFTSGANTFIEEIDPSTGAVLAGPSLVNFSSTGGGVGVDLGACLFPPTLQLQKDVINRQADTDQFALSITGGGITQGNAATTSGTENGVQADTAGPVLARVDTTYTFTETAAGTTTLANYTITWQCVDQGAGNAVIASGTGPTFTLTPAPGQAVLCTFSNSAPRLTLDKTSPATQIVPGEEVTYTLTVTNTGAQPATDVVVTDTLPIGLTFVSSTPPCTAVGQVVTCNLGTVAANSASTIEMVTVAADPFPPDALDPSGNVVNAARVTSPGSNCPEGSTDPECTDEVPLPVPTTIEIEKTSSTTQIVPGANVPYTLTVTNTGSAPAASVVVTDTLPTGLTFVSSPDGCTADAALVVVTCNIGTLLAGGSATRNIVTVAADPFPAGAIDPSGNVVNAATVTSPNTNCPPGSSDPECTDEQPLPVQPTIAIEKASDVTEIVPGEEVPYTLTVTNTGPVPATDVVVTDVLPEGLTFVSSDPDCTALVQVVTCELGVIDAGDSVTIELVTEAADPFPGADVSPDGTVVNGARVTSPGSNCPEGSTDPECTDEVPLPVQPTIAIDKTSGVTEIVPGEEVPYTLTVTNTGPVPATDVVVTDTLPIGLSFVSPTPPCTAAGQVVTCNLGTVAANDVVTIDMVTSAANPFPGTGISPDGTVVNGARVTSPGTNCPEGSTDPDCTDEVPLPVFARLTLVKLVENNFGGTAEPVDWTLNAAGPTTISGVTGSDDVTGAPVDAGPYELSESDGPPGYVSGAWTCTSQRRGSFRTPQVIELSPGESLTCTVTNFDAPATLTLVKEVINDHGGTAAATEWTLNATGAEPAGEIVTGPTGSDEVTNRLVPADTYALSETDGPEGYTASDWVCEGTGRQDGASITLAVGQTATCTITNDDIQPELTLEKTSGVSRVTPGSQVPYTYTVTNVSAVTATQIVVTDPLPAGLTFVSSPDGCTVSGVQVVQCTADSLGPGDSITFRIVTQAADPFPDASIGPDGMVPNTATVTSPNTNCPPEEAEPAAGILLRAAISPQQATAEDCGSTVRLPLEPTLLPIPSPPTPPPATPSPDAGEGGLLPRTGAQIGGFLLMAAILIGAGRLLVVLARRRGHVV